MPALSETNGTVLVTGANGFIAAWLVGDLLKQGYKVRAAVRTEDKGKHLLETYKSYGDKLQLIAVGDIRKEDAFDEAVKDVEGIIHAASPVAVPTTLKDVEPKELIDPAVGGAVGILNSALKNGNALQRLIFISSCLTIRTFSLTPITLGDADWNDEPVKECEEKGIAADGLSKYAAGKTLAEKATWKFYEENKSKINWDIVVVNPAWVFGPSKHHVTDFNSLPPSTQIFYGAIVKGDFGGYPPLYAPGHGFTDVRDVAAALTKALASPDASGERIIISSRSWVWQDLVDAANSLSPPPYSKPITKGTPGQAVRNITFDTSKEKKYLGIKFRTPEEVTKDLLTEFETRGF